MARDNTVRLSPRWVQIPRGPHGRSYPIEGHGQAVPRGQLLQQGEIAMQILSGTEVEREDGAGGVVDGAEEEQGRPRPEPVERAAVDEDEAAHGRVPGPAGPVRGGPAAPLRGQAEGPPEAADRLATDREALDLAELLGAVAVIEVAVGGLDERLHAVPEFDIQRPGRGPAPQAMDQPPDALGPIPGLQAPELPRGHIEGEGAGGRCNVPAHRELHQARPVSLLATHRDDLPCLHGRTFLPRS